MHSLKWIGCGASIAALVGCGDQAPSIGSADAPSMRHDGTVMPGHESRNAYEVERLVSDDHAIVPAKFQDPLLKNAWGLAAGPDTFWWVANAETGFATVYDAEGVKQALEVDVPGEPTGQVYSGGDGFLVSCDVSGPARFIFASEDGTISAWSPGVPAPGPSREAFVMVDNSAAGAIYKGLAIATTKGGGDRLYATDFHNGKIDVFDEGWRALELPDGAFMDGLLPRGYAPFGIRAIDGRLIVTYALQDDDAEDDVAGKGLGVIDAFDLDGRIMQRIATGMHLNAPWGLAMSPPDFGKLGGMLLVANFGDGRINAYDLAHCGLFGCKWRGALRNAERGGAISIEGLWGIDFAKGNDKTGGTDELYFTAGPNDEANGLFGYIEVAGEAEEE